MRKRRLTAVLAVALSTLTLTTACGGSSSKSDSTLNMLGIGDVDYMDPNIAYYSGSYTAERLWARQLFTYPAVNGKTTDEVPDLATEMPTQANGGVSADGKTIKVTIKTGAKWDTSPARQITAEDAVRGLKRTCNPSKPFGGMPDFQNLIVGLAAYCDGFAKVDAKSATAIANYQNQHTIAGATVDPSNKLTVVYKLTSPASYFVNMLALSSFTPAPVEYDKYVPASAQLAQHTIASGPYKITAYNPTKSISMVRNPAWVKSTDSVRGAYVDKVEINETGQQAAIQEQLQANSPSADMEWDTFPPVTSVPQLQARKDPNLTLGPQFSSNPYLVFNTVSASNGGALKNKAVRVAITEALNRAHFTQDCGGKSVCPPLTHILPEGISGTSSNTSPNPYSYNESKAKSDLAAAGHSKMTLKFLYRATSLGTALFTTVQQDLAKVGITVQGVVATNADFYVKYLNVPSVAKRGVWDVAIAGWGPDWYGDAAASFFLPLFYGNDGKSGSAFPPNGSNFGFYNNAQVDQLITQATSASSSDAAAAIWKQVDQLVTSDAAIYPITAPNQPVYKATHTTNAIFMPYLQQYDPANVKLTSS